MFKQKLEENPFYAEDSSKSSSVDIEILEHTKILANRDKEPRKI